MLKGNIVSRSLADFSNSLTLIGAGNMAGAMLARWLDEGLNPALVTVVRPSGAPVAEGVRVVTDLADAGISSGIVMLGFKPQQLPQLSADIAAVLPGGVTLVSILAGVSSLDLNERFSGHDAVRAMPNMPVRDGLGVVLLAGKRNPAVAALMDSLGHAQWLEDEASFDLYTAVAGCGPAYVYRFVEALAAAGTRLGLPADEANAITRAMVTGAAMTVERSPFTPGELVTQVASKGGMTQAGLDVLDEDGRLVALLTDMLRAARDRGKELADMARSDG